MGRFVIGGFVRQGIDLLSFVPPTAQVCPAVSPTYGAIDVLWPHRGRNHFHG